jgi:predicted ABC-type ATPase
VCAAASPCLEGGFRLHLFDLWIPGPELGLLRIRYRVEGGGQI